MNLLSSRSENDFAWKFWEIHPFLIPRFRENTLEASLGKFLVKIAKSLRWRGSKKSFLAAKDRK